MRIEHTLDFKVLSFPRDPTIGTPNYGNGFVDTQCSADIFIDFDPGAITLLEQDLEGIRVEYANYMLQLKILLHNTAVLDNEDAFFRNMIPAHIWETFNSLFTDAAPMHFTPEITPPPSRLEFPMLVGNNEARLFDDMQVWLRGYLERGLENIRFQVGDVQFAPDLTVSIPELRVTLLT